MRSREELERLFGGPEGLLKVQQHVRANVDQMPPLTSRQRDGLRLIFGTRTMPRRPQKKRTAPLQDAEREVEGPSYRATTDTERIARDHRQCHPNSQVEAGS